MPTRSMPSRPSLAQLKLQARELQRDHASKKPAAGARIAGHHPRWKERPVDAVLAESLALADAQLVIAREYGFRSWALLKRHVETARRVAGFRPHPDFDRALAAVDSGDLETLRNLIAREPELLRARTRLEPPYDYFTGATLLHHVAGNPSRDSGLPRNIVDVAQLLLEAGADANAVTLATVASTTLGLVITSKAASDASVSGPLIELLVEHGARVDLEDPAVLDGPLANHAPRAAEKLIELGAEPDLLAAAALGRMDLIASFFDDDGNLHVAPRRNGATMSERDAIGLALLFAYVNRHEAVVDFLLEHDGNWNMTGVNNGAALHRAAWAGDLAMVQRLVAQGADLSNRDNPFNSTPLSWAQHNRQQAVIDWFRTNTRVDLHDAVCLGFREHVEARLREDPAAVHHRIHQWDMPQATPLHWAAWPRIEDIDGEHALDANEREQLVKLLLDHGADRNAVAGNGLTALDIALAGEAAGIASLLERHGAKRASAL
ncbi:MAG: hypothetical protein L0271_12980 [Gemmatimonadetes bacterium]|nr:hypothetical protein [Gemmatimonadota bacterium]